MNFAISILDNGRCIETMTVRARKSNVDDDYTYWYCKKTQHNDLVQWISRHDSKMFGTHYNVAVFRTDSKHPLANHINRGRYTIKVKPL